MHLSTYMYVHVLYMNSPNYLQRGIFLLLIALIAGYLHQYVMISRLEILKIRGDIQIRMWNNIGIAKETRLGCLVHIVQ